MCKVSDKSEMVGEIIGWFDMELPSYHPHTMECIITIEGSDVVVNVVCNVLDRLGCEARYICSLRYYSISFDFVYFLVGAAKTMLMK